MRIALSSTIADNGAFAHKGFLDEVNRKDQRITFCAVGAHHQNGIIENKNKMLTLAARTLFLHGIRMWPQMIDSVLAICFQSHCRET